MGATLIYMVTVWVFEQLPVAILVIIVCFGQNDLSVKGLMQL